MTPSAGAAVSFRRWLLKGHESTSGTAQLHRHTAPWWRIMCLTGVDYFSTLGYQPSIAFLAAGYLSPFATLVLVVLTLAGALPIYRAIAALSPNGQGSMAVLERYLPGWRGKTFVLVLLGFAATDYIITVTLSAADATAHIVENPFIPHWMDHPVGLTLVLVLALGAIFLKGFKEAIWLAVTLVVLYVGLNVVVLTYELAQLVRAPAQIEVWWSNLFAQQANPLLMVGFTLLLFPKLALGLSGFETGVAVMPLIKGKEPSGKEPSGEEPSGEKPSGEEPSGEEPSGSYPSGEGPSGKESSGDEPSADLSARVRGAQKMLTTAALIMSALLVASALVTATRIPGDDLRAGGLADGRALAYLAHRDFGELFGSIYDLATIAILWFAGSSAVAGLLNLVPRYLPRYGMAPDWAKATRPLVVVITLVCCAVTIAFRADVNAQGGAYATGVLVLMTSAAVAVSMALPRLRRWFIPITLVFIYTTVVNIIERPEGIQIASLFIVGIIGASLISRVLRSTEVRIEGVDYDDAASKFIQDVAGRRAIRIVASRPRTGSATEYAAKFANARTVHHLQNSEVLFLEVTPRDASEFSDVLHVSGVEIGGYRVLRCTSPAVPNAIAGLLLDIRNRTFAIPHVYFGWTEGNPLAYLLKFLIFGEGDVAPVCREVLRQAEPDPEKRPRVHLG